MKVSKKRKVALTKVDANKSYTIEEASKVVKEITTTKFDSSVDLAMKVSSLRSSVFQSTQNTMVSHGISSLRYSQRKAWAFREGYERIHSMKSLMEEL